MFFFISKILAFLIQPLVWVLILMILAWKVERKRRIFLLAAFFTLYFFSNQFIFLKVIRAYEAEAKTENQLKENYQAAIILGGMVSLDDEHGLVAFAESSDRFLAILPLYFDQRVEKIIISGGSGSIFQEEKEADVLKSYLLKIGVSSEDILIDTQSKNTYENALNTSQLIEQNDLKGPFLLSTSASHMPRAQRCFKKQGIEFDTYPVDQYAIGDEFSVYGLLVPQSEVLVKWKWLIHEWMGLLSYKLKGYI